MMWKKRKDEVPKEPTPAPQGRETYRSTASRAPVAPAPPPTVPKAAATIGKSVRIKGQIYSQEDLRLDGQVEGTIELPDNQLTIGPTGKVQAAINARAVDVLGTVQGDITAGEKITIRKAANLVGDLKSATISIEDGAYFKGSIDIVRQAPKPSVVTGTPPRVQAPGASPTSSRAESTSGGGPTKGKAKL